MGGKTWSSAWDMLYLLDPCVRVDIAAGWEGFKGEVRARMAVWVGSAGAAMTVGDLPWSQVWTEEGLRAE